MKRKPSEGEEEAQERGAGAGREGAEEAFVLPVEPVLDLHAFHPGEIPDVVASYLEEAHRHGFREVRLVHGKGIGVQRARVQSLLARHPLVEGFADAPAERGHWGATIVRLIPPQRESG